MYGGRGSPSWSRATTGRPFSLGRTSSAKTTPRGGIRAPDGAIIARKKDDMRDDADVMSWFQACFFLLYVCWLYGSGNSTNSLPGLLGLGLNINYIITVETNTL